MGAPKRGGGRPSGPKGLPPKVKAAPSTHFRVAKTKKGRRALDARAPKLEENEKKMLVLRGRKTSQVIKDSLSDLARLKGAPHVVRFARDNDVDPFGSGGGGGDTGAAKIKGGKRDRAASSASRAKGRAHAPGDGAGDLERLAARADCSLVLLGSHSKKRPHNLVLGRTHDGRMLDLAEFGVDPTTHRSIDALARDRSNLRKRATEAAEAAGLNADEAAARAAAVVPDVRPGVGHKPMFVFLGDGFEAGASGGGGGGGDGAAGSDAAAASAAALAALKSMLIDALRGREVRTVNLRGLDRVVVCASGGGVARLRCYGVRPAPPGASDDDAATDSDRNDPANDVVAALATVHGVSLCEIGPRLDLVPRRCRTAAAVDPALRRSAYDRPKLSGKARVKNAAHDPLLGRVGRVHLQAQEVDAIALSKPKGVKRERREAAAERAAARQDAPAREGGGRGGRGAVEMGEGDGVEMDDDS